MRVWDCCPSLLARQHLGGEWNEIHAVWNSVWRRCTGVTVNPETGRRYGWLSHPETVRFCSRPELLVARWDFLQREGERRGLRYVKPLEVGLPDGVRRGDDYRSHSVSEDTDWLEWAARVGWPPLDGRYWSPWVREGYDYDHYRTRSQYADLPLRQRAKSPLVPGSPA